MTLETHVHEFDFASDQTCKIHWRFEVLGKGDDAIVRDITITPSLTDNGKEKGCQAHPKTIQILARGRRVSDLDIEALAAAVCPRDTSCAQALAHCLAQIREQ